VSYWLRTPLQRWTIQLIHLTLPPWDFWLFPKLKIALKERRFADLSDIQRNVKTLLRGITENDVQDRFQQWHRRLTKCMASQEECLEGDSSTGKQIVLS
jgi:hypothetical protein